MLLCLPGGRFVVGRRRLTCESRKDHSWPLATTARTTPRSPARISFAKISEPLEVPQLLALQTDSFDWLIGNEKWQEQVAERRGRRRGRLPEVRSARDLRGDLADRGLLRDDVALLREPGVPRPEVHRGGVQGEGLHLLRPLYVSAEFTNGETGEIKGQTVFMGDFPMMTRKGTFIINGTERVVVSPAGPLAGRLLRAHRRQDLRQGHLHRQGDPVAAAPGWSSRSTSATWSASASTASASRTSRCCSRPSAGPTSRSARSSASTSR